MSNITVSSSYIEPYPQPALNGEKGLNSEELAIALGTTKHAIETVLAKSGFIDFAKKEGLNIATIVAETQNRGRKPRMWVLDAECCKVFAARYGSEEGFKYSLWSVS